MRNFFSQFARGISQLSGSAYAFIIALGSVIVWAGLGPAFHYSARWQLVINTGTTIVTFLMVFLIQNAQNHDQAALQLKLDELLKAVTGARTGFINLEELTEDEIDALRDQFRTIAEKHESDVAVVTAKAEKAGRAKEAEEAEQKREGEGAEKERAAPPKRPAHA